MSQRRGALMAVKHIAYVHLLLFCCKQCNKPVSISGVSDVGNLEEIDGNTYEVECRCGWLENLLGVEALRHWVVPWEQRDNVHHRIDRAEGIGFSN